MRLDGLALMAGGSLVCSAASLIVVVALWWHKPVVTYVLIRTPVPASPPIFNPPPAPPELPVIKAAPKRKTTKTKSIMKNRTKHQQRIDRRLHKKPLRRKKQTSKTRSKRRHKNASLSAFLGNPSGRVNQRILRSMSIVQLEPLVQPPPAPPITLNPKAPTVVPAAPLPKTPQIMTEESKHSSVVESLEPIDTTGDLVSEPPEPQHTEPRGQNNDASLALAIILAEPNQHSQTEPGPDGNKALRIKSIDDATQESVRSYEAIIRSLSAESAVIIESIDQDTEPEDDHNAPKEQILEDDNPLKIIIYTGQDDHKVKPESMEVALEVEEESMNVATEVEDGSKEVATEPLIDNPDMSDDDSLEDRVYESAEEDEYYSAEDEPNEVQVVNAPGLQRSRSIFETFGRYAKALYRRLPKAGRIPRPPMTKM